MSLRPFTTLEVGGPARFFAQVHTREELIDVLGWAAHHHLPVLPLGKGSNVLVSDGGFDGVVVVQEKGVWRPLDAAGRIFVDGGVEWDHLVEYTVREGWAGIECLSGIPGLVGAAPIQNIGAYGQEVASVVTMVHAVDRVTATPRTFDYDACAFGYRTSIFKGPEAHRWIVTGLELKLKVNERPHIVYRDLLERLSAESSLAEVRAAVLSIRGEKSMLLQDGDPNRRSAGSFFLNPELTPEELDALHRRLREMGISPQTLPTHPGAHHRFKVSAAWLIEKAGFTRGFVLGRAGLSSRHTLALVNRGDATARDILVLAARIRRSVQAQFGVGLHPEPVFIGFSEDSEALLKKFG